MLVEKVPGNHDWASARLYTKTKSFPLVEMKLFLTLKLEEFRPCLRIRIAAPSDEFRIGGKLRMLMEEFEKTPPRLKALGVLL